MIRAPQSTSRPRRHLVLLLLGCLLALVALGGVTSAAGAQIPANYLTVIDQDGANDVPSQNDLTLFGRDDSLLSTYTLLWSWDATDDWAGTGQTGNACALFDANGNGMVDFVVCAEVENPGAVMTIVSETAGSPYAFQCDDSKIDRCGQPTPVTIGAGDVETGSITPPGTNLISATDPFPDLNPDQNWPNDSTIAISIAKSFLPLGADLINVCSYPSAGNGGNNNPFDCILRPGDGLMVIKKVIPAGTTQAFGFEADPGDKLFTLTPSTVAGQTLTAQTAPFGMPSGNTSSVTETIPTDWNLVSAVCRLEDGTTQTGTLAGNQVSGITVEPGRVTTCTFTDAGQGRIQIDKLTQPSGSEALFTFDPGPGIGGAAEANFDLADATTPKEFTVPAGTYTVTELAKSGWDLTTIACDDSNSTGSGSTATFVVAAGETVKCTFTNVQRGLVQVDKVTQPSGDPALFTFDPGPGLGAAAEPDFDLADGTAVKDFSVAPGTYTVAEAAKAGWRLQSIACDDSNSTGSGRTATFVVAAGETVKCTFTNVKLEGAAIVVKSGTELAHHGDDLVFEFVVTNGGNTPLHDVTVSDDRCSPVEGPVAALSTGEEDLILDLQDRWVYSCTYALGDHPATGEVDGVIHNIATAAGLDEQDQPVSSTDGHDTTVLHPGVEVDKMVRIQGVGDFVDGPIQTYVGDTLEYRFEVVNTGDTPLTITELSDPKCDADTISGPVKAGDEDNLLEGEEVWTWTCTHVVTAAEADPVHNTVTVTGEDTLGGESGTVTDTDEAQADVLHPAIDIDKSGPATAQAGQAVGYSLVVTNPGDVAIVGQTIGITDAKCDAPPVLVGKFLGNGADPTPDTLDPGDTWTYGCTVMTAVGQTSVLNTALVNGSDLNGRNVTDTDDAGTALTQPAIAVLPEVIVSGASKLRGPSACVTKTFKVTITGRRIASVTITIDGRKVKTFRNKAGEGKRFVLKVKSGRYGDGMHRLRARVVYNPASQTRPRTLQMSFERCAKQVIQPLFTG